MDLSCLFMGFRLRNPLVAASSPLTGDLDSLRKLEDAGLSAAVLPSLFEEQIEIEQNRLDENLLRGTESFAEALSYFPALDSYRIGAEDYLDLIRRAKEALSIPVIGSLNGVSTGGWIRYAGEIQDAGADALELNVYFIPTDPAVQSGTVEQMTLKLVRDIQSRIRIPVSVKLSPYYSALPNVIRRLDQAGARAVVLFNRFYQPDLDLESMSVVPGLKLSTPDELKSRLRWVSILYGQTDADLAVTGGVHTAGDIAKCVLAGASAVMVASALLEGGPARAGIMLRELGEWVERKGFQSLTEMKGNLSHQSIAEPAAYERANYMKVLGSYS
ncbi:dihydroorotate dehydrogenase-like protein [bacterium]|nr:dihydroorotate dehydrogenase-like protein [bacterium]